MRKIIYYVAITLDGYVSGPDDDVSGFVYTGSGVDTYFNDLKSFDTVIMGRSTYEFGYRFGAIPGEPSPAYPHMKHYIFSNNLKLDSLHPQVQVKKLSIDEIEELKNEAGSDIYLCGGGQLAGWLLDHQKIDVLKLKLNPLIMGGGTKMFGQSTAMHKLELVDTSRYENDLQILTYNVIYDKDREISIDP
jgi:dihydrofolate reductase